MLLIGDSAGLAYPQSGEGIRPAVESALLAAQVILDCQGDYRRENLLPYVDRLEARFGQREPAPGLMERLPAGFRQNHRQGADEKPLVFPQHSYLPLVFARVG